MHASKKHLLETMGSGVALLDYDNDGLLDIIFVKIADPPSPLPKFRVRRPHLPHQNHR